MRGEKALSSGTYIPGFFWVISVLIPLKQLKKKRKTRELMCVGSDGLTRLGSVSNKLRVWDQTPCPEAKYFLVLPSHSVNKYIVL